MSDATTSRLRLGMPAEELLARRLELLGLKRLPSVRRVKVHRNRIVMLSLSTKGVLRLHEGYAHAPDRVLRAIVRFLDRRNPRDLRKAMESVFLAFPVDRYAPPRTPRRTDPPQPGDVALYTRLQRLHQRLNERYFGGRLKAIPIRLSNRMRTRLGEIAVDLRTGRVVEMALSRHHLRTHTWDEVEHTVLHEMVHQWQAENHLPVDHGPAFRRKAIEVGIEPRARRHIRLARHRKAG